MLDKVFATIGMLGLIAFLGVVMVFVMEPDLWVVTLVMLTIAIIYFLRDIKAGGSRLENKPRDDRSES